MPSKILIVYESGKVVNVFANGDAELYVKHLGETPCSQFAVPMPTTIVTTENFERMITDRFSRGRWTITTKEQLAVACDKLEKQVDDLAGVKGKNETKPDSEDISKTDHR